MNTYDKSNDDEIQELESSVINDIGCIMKCEFLLLDKYTQHFYVSQE